MSQTAAVAVLRAAGCVFAEEEARLIVAEAQDDQVLNAMLARRVAGAPLEHVLGWVEFCGRRVAVDPGVFVPRRRTAYLVERAARVAPLCPVVVDLCCGCGAIGAALTSRLPDLTLVAADIDPAAVRCARRNLPRARVLRGDLFDALPSDLRGRVDVLVANVPYVPSEAVALLPVEAREHEPRLALDGGPDGLDVFRRVVEDASTWLAPGGTFLAEMSEDQAPTATALLATAGLSASAATSERFGTTVVSGASKGS
jgi:release factor glutamine methyltransferase